MSISYLDQLISLARQFHKPVSVDLTEVTRYSVYIENVTCGHYFIYGYGTTIEDACYDYMRKCRGSYVRNYITGKSIEVI